MLVRSIDSHSLAIIVIDSGQGFTIQISRMTAVSSNVFLLQRGRLRTVPTTLEKFHSVFEIMQSMVVTKVRLSLLFFFFFSIKG